MAGRTSIIIQGTAWSVQETKNGKRFLRVSVSPGYRDRNGNWVSQPEQNYSVWPTGYVNLNPVFATRSTNFVRIKTSSWT